MSSDCVALETTLLTHGVPRDQALGLARDLCGVITGLGVRPVIVGVHRGHPTVGLSQAQLLDLLGTPDLPKANSSNLGLILHRGLSAATTVSATMELAAGAGVEVFATGGLGGVHRGYAQRLDISADLAAFTRFPVTVVASGVKSILDVESTREALETLGIPVIGFRTDRFPAFYLPESDAGVDGRFDDVPSMAAFVKAELARTGRGLLICNPIPAQEALEPGALRGWLEQAQRELGPGAAGREATPGMLAALHRISGGATLRANIALARSNAKLAAQLCRALQD